MLDALEDNETNFRFNEDRLWGRGFNQALNRLHRLFDKERNRQSKIKKAKPLGFAFFVKIFKEILTQIFLTALKFQPFNCLN
jgi:hypothetical protein